MARMSIDAKFFCDGRIALLKKKLKEPIGMTRNRLLEVWQYCYQHVTEYLDPEMVDAIGDHDQLSNLMVEVGLGELHEGKFLVKGVSKRIQYIREAKGHGKRGADKRWNFKGLSNIDSETLKGSDRVGYKTPIGFGCSSTSTSTSTKEPPYPPLLKLDRIWNENCGSLPKVSKLREYESRRLLERISENGNEAYWISVVQRIASSDFCNGRGTKGWQASFSWILKPENHHKVSDGAYDNKSSQPRPASAKTKTLTLEEFKKLERGL